LVEKSSPH